jgi:hypothetical protein
MPLISTRPWGAQGGGDRCPDVQAPGRGWASAPGAVATRASVGRGGGWAALRAAATRASARVGARVGCAGAGPREREVGRGGGSERGRAGPRWAARTRLLREMGRGQARSAGRGTGLVGCPSAGLGGRGEEGLGQLGYCVSFSPLLFLSLFFI